MCLMALTMNAQRCAVLEFKAGVGISQADVDGISAIFITYFQPAGYTMVERSQIDKAIEEQRFQRSSMTESQMVRIGQILNVSKIVVGDVNIVMGQYNVDARVINIETGTVSATEGATFAKGASYRATMQSLAQKLAGKIAIRQGTTVAPSTPSTPSTPTARTRSKVEVLYGYLKIFPNELGVFQAEPSSVIAQINKQAQHGYNNWRIPTNEELSLMRANNYLGSGEYMTRESKRGIVLLVTDGEDYQTIQEKARKAEEERIKAEEEERIKAEEERKAAEERRAAELKAQGLVDLGLPSGTLWRDKNEEGGFYTYGQAMAKFGDRLPTKEQFKELTSKCQWSWTGSGYKVTGPNGNSITLPAAGYLGCDDGRVSSVGYSGNYWSSTPDIPAYAWFLWLDSGDVRVSQFYRCIGRSVRLVQD